MGWDTEISKANMNLRVIRIDKMVYQEDSPFKTYNFQSWYIMIIGKNLSLIRNM